MTSNNPFSKNLIFRFFQWDAAPGVILIAAALCAMIVANGPLADLYQAILHDTYIRVGFMDGGVFTKGIEKNVLHWINDWMMVFFFMHVGLEIKREMYEGSLNTPKKALLPLLCALGGMAVPGMIYAFINHGSPDTMAGWAIPTATDIAFAIGIISLLGRRVPSSLKILLLAVAILDDLGAIILIALFYTDQLHTNILLFCMVPIGAMIVMSRMKVWHVAPYLAFGTILWAAVLESGVHATLAGVITALFIPMKAKGGHPSPLKKLEHDLSPWVAFVIMPVFAFANAGVSLAGIGMEDLFHPLTLGIILGLILGKQIGIFGTLYSCVKMRICVKPDNASWAQIYAMALLCGIGFTMSLFIGGLAFPDDTEMQNSVRLGVLVGSVFSAILAYILFLWTSKNNKAA
ncbi:MAG: Na+/H+ antiporter NhaA [Micavibrio sp.]